MAGYFAGPQVEQIPCSISGRRHHRSIVLKRLAEPKPEIELRFTFLYAPPALVVISKAKGAKVWDVDGKMYYDFLSAYRWARGW